MSETEVDRDFGDTAVERGFIIAEQLEKARAHRKESSGGQSLAAVLVELGYITPFQEKTISRFCQQALEKADEELSPGNIIGKTLGGCKVLESIGSGGMGTTYRARHSRLDRDVCVKVLHPRLTRIVGMAERFQREARTAASLSHPNVVQVFDFDQRGAMYFMIMEYVSGRNLKEIVEGSGPFSLSQAVWVVSQVLQGLNAAHELGIVHRDIKPSNILFDKDSNRVYISDFGTVRILSSSTSETLSAFGEILGTPQYMAPEQATADVVDGRTDLYGVGMMLFELLEGHPAFTGNSVVEVLEKQILRPLPSLSKGKYGLNEFVQKMCAKSSADRYSNAMEAGRALEVIYRRICKTATYANKSPPDIRVDPTRSAGSREPTVDETTIEAIAGRLRMSQKLCLVSFEDESANDPIAEDLRQDSSIPRLPFQTPAESENADGTLLRTTEPSGLEERDHKDTHEILQLAMSGDLAKAIPDLTRDTRGKQLIPELLLLLWKNGQKDKILELSPQLETALPSMPAIPFFTGLTHAEREDYEKARSSFAVAVALDTSHVPAQIHLATCLLKLDRDKEARRTLRRAALLNPASVLAAVRYAEFLAGPARDYKAASVAYEKAISLAPDRMVLRRKLGAIWCRMDQLEDAESVAAEIVEWCGQEDEAKALRELIEKRLEARANSKSDRLMRVIVDDLPFEDAVKTKRKKRASTKRHSQLPPDIRARLELMRLAVAAKKWPWVVDIYRQGVAAYPNVSQFHLAFGQAALKLGRPRKAVQAFEKSLALRANSRKAREGLEKARKRLADEEKSP
jgi:serine/threonine protein kinase